MAKPLLLPLAVAAALGGCAAPQAAAVRTGALGVSRPATTTELFDGSYQGRAVLVRGSRPTCPVWPRYGTVEIGDAVLIYPYLPGLVFSAPVQPNGSLHSQTGQFVLDGRIVNGHLDFTVITPACASRYSMRYVWNHS